MCRVTDENGAVKLFQTLEVKLTPNALAGKVGAPIEAA
jgi:hypothetical protein